MARGLTIGPIGSPYTLQANPVGFNYLMYSRALQQSAGAPGFALGAGPVSFAYAPQAQGYIPPLALSFSPIAFSFTAQASALNYSTVLLPVATPTFSPLPGLYSGPITITDATPLATIYYTIDGTTPIAGTSVLAQPSINGISGNLWVHGGTPGGNPPNGVFGLISEQANPQTGNGSFQVNSWSAGAFTGFFPVTASTAQLSYAATGTSPSSTAQAEGGTLGVYLQTVDLPGQPANSKMMITAQQNFANQVIWGTSQTVLSGSMNLQFPTATGGSSNFLNVNHQFYLTANPSLGFTFNADIFHLGQNSPGVINVTQDLGATNTYIINLPIGKTVSNPYLTSVAGVYSSAVVSAYTNYAWTISYAQFQAALQLAATQLGPIAGWSTNPGDWTMTEMHVNAEIHYQSGVSDGTLGWSMNNWVVNLSTPATSAIYTAPIPLSSTATLKAIATAPNLVPSATGSATYTQNVLYIPGHRALSGNVGGSPSPNGNGRNLSEIQTSLGASRVNWKGYVAQYNWTSFEGATLGSYNFAGLIADFNTLQQYAPGMDFSVLVKTAALAQSPPITSSNYLNAWTQNVPKYILNDTTGTYGAVGPNGVNRGYVLVANAGGSSVSTMSYTGAYAARHVMNVSLRYVALFQAMAATPCTLSFGPYAGQTFPLGQHPLFHVAGDWDEYSIGMAQPFVPSDYTEAGEVAAWSAFYEGMAAAFPNRITTGYNSFGNARSSNQHADILALINAGNTAKTFAYSDSDCIPPWGVAGSCNAVDGQNLFVGNTFSSTNVIFLAPNLVAGGGTDRRGQMASIATVQPSDFNLGTPGTPTTTQLQAIYNMAVANNPASGGTPANGLNAGDIWWSILAFTSRGGSVIANWWSATLAPFIASCPPPVLTIPTNLAGSSSLAVLTGPLSATAGFPLVQALQVAQGTAPYTWSLTAQSGGNGATLASNGLLSIGSPVASGTITVSATDALGASTGNVVLAVNVTAVTGALTFTAPTMPAATAGGAYFFNFLAKGSVTGGRPPYSFYVGPSYQQTVGGYTGASGTVWLMQSSYDSGFLQAAVTGSGTDSVPVTVVDSLGATASITASIVINSALNITGVSLDQTIGQLPAAMVGNVYGAGGYGPAHTAAGGTAPYTWSIVSGAPPGLSLRAGGSSWQGTPSTAGLYSSILVKVTDQVGATDTQTFSMTVVANQNVAIPSWQGSGHYFFQKSGQFYDPDGAPFRLRGFDRAHYNNGNDSAAFVASRASCVRYELYEPASEATQAADVQSQHINNNCFPVVMRYTDSQGNSSTGSATIGIPTVSNTQHAGGLGLMVHDWIVNSSLWLPIQGDIGLNIANEWGPTNNVNFLHAYQATQGAISGMTTTTLTLSTVSATHPFANSVALQYVYISSAGGVSNQLCLVTAVGGSSGAWTITGTFPSGWTSGGTCWGGAVGMLRAAGYLCPLFIDSGNSGQDTNDFLNYAAEILASDPIQNCVFSYHLYGATTNVACPITSITTGGSTTVHYTGPAWMSAGYNNNPFDTFEYNGDFLGKGVVYGAGGVTGLNTNVGTLSNQAGTQPNWSASLTVASSGTYTSGGWILDASHYKLVLANLAALQSQGVCICVLEFGPATPPLTVGAGSNTLVNDGMVIRTCEANGIGWARWAMDDGSTGTVTNNGYTVCALAGLYTGSASQLSYSGLEPMLNPIYGVGALSTPASWFL